MPAPFGGLRSLLGRIEGEMAYNDAKGTSPYRMGMQDGLHFARDAIAALLAENATNSPS